MSVPAEAPCGVATGGGRSEDREFTLAVGWPGVGLASWRGFEDVRLGFAFRAKCSVDPCVRVVSARECTRAVSGVPNAPGCCPVRQVCFLLECAVPGATRESEIANRFLRRRL